VARETRGVAATAATLGPGSARERHPIPSPGRPCRPDLQTTGLEEFERTLKEDFDRDPEKFREAFAQVKTLDELDRRNAQPLIEAVTYLEALDEAIPDDDPLCEERTLLTARCVLETFCRQPSQASAVLEACEGFKRS
jgi:hypothetical protein